MWLSEKMAGGTPGGTALQQGQISLAGEAPAVITDGQLTKVRVLSPGGYAWQPALGDGVLVSALEDPVILGKLQSPAELLPGEVRLYAGKAGISLRPDGSIHLTGEVFINGQKWKEEALDDDLT